jgi:hypothetical protein
MTYTFNTFTTKQEYLAARQQWKDEYANLSDAIRATKLGIKQRMKAGEYAGRLQGELLSQKRLANQMLTALDDAKVEAQKQYLKELEDATVQM